LNTTSTHAAHTHTCPLMHAVAPSLLLPPPYTHVHTHTHTHLHTHAHTHTHTHTHTRVHTQ